MAEKRSSPRAERRATMPRMIAPVRPRPTPTTWITPSAIFSDRS
jgi:hypothetical protein